MKKIINIKYTALCAASLLISLPVVFAGCATSSGFTDLVSAAGQVAGAAGYSQAATVINAGASVSKAAEDITPEQEYYIGRAVAATIFTTYKPYDTAEKEAYVNKICAVLVANSSKPELYNGYHVKILDSDEINAFSTSGGHILITRGLLSCASSEDALAAVIAHEIAHIQLQHSIKAISASRWTSAGLQSVNAGISVATGSDSSQLSEQLGGMVNDVISQMVNKGYSQTQEFAADSLALTLMADAGYQPSAMNDMLNVMKSKLGSSAGGFGKTHPSPDKRIANVNKTLTTVQAVKDTRNARTARFATIMK